MMTVYVNREPEGCIRSAQSFFDFEYEDDWFDDPLVKQIVKDIDNTEVISSNMLISPILGSISCRDISGGAKGLILILKCTDHRAFRSTTFGGNCVNWIIALSRSCDFILYMDHCLEFMTRSPGPATSIQAKSEFGKSLATCEEVVLYYEENRDKSPE